MGDFREDRPQLLRSGAALAAGAATVALARPAAAWQLQEYGSASPLARAIANHCSAGSEHAALIAKLKAELADTPAVQSLSAVCPLCRCPVVVAR